MGVIRFVLTVMFFFVSVCTLIQGYLKAAYVSIILFQVQFYLQAFILLHFKIFPVSTEIKAGRLSDNGTLCSISGIPVFLSPPSADDG